MRRFGTIVLALLLLSNYARAQSIARQEVAPLGSAMGLSGNQPIRLEFGDTTFLERLWLSGGLDRSYASLLVPRVPIDSIKKDSSDDSVVVNVTMGGMRYRAKRPHSFVLTDLENARQQVGRERFSMLDFNRVTGFFLGLGSSGMTDIGKHDELGLDGGLGYGFASKRWEYFLGGEFRLPIGLRQVIASDTSLSGRNFFSPPTIAVGAEFHNQTQTEDHWRASREENSAYAFFAREDFRDYFKLAGWGAYVAWRPTGKKTFHEPAAFGRLVLK